MILASGGDLNKWGRSPPKEEDWCMPAPLSLLEELARIPDPRNRRGTRHPLPAILGLTVLAMLTGCKSYTAIA